MAKTVAEQFVEKLQNFNNFVRPHMKTAHNAAADLMFPDDEEGKKQFLEAVATQMEQNEAQITSNSPFLIFQLAQASLYKNLEICEKILDPQVGNVDCFQFMFQQAGPNPSPTTRMLMATAMPVLNLGSPEDVVKFRRYLQYFVTATIGSDLTAAKKAYESQKDHFDGIVKKHEDEQARRGNRYGGLESLSPGSGGDGEGDQGGGSCAGEGEKGKAKQE